MIEIKILHKSAADVIELVQQLRNSGLVQGSDFDFSYHPEEFVAVQGTGTVIPRYATIKFYDEKHATMFALKWC